MEDLKQRKEELSAFYQRLRSHLVNFHAVPELRHNPTVLSTLMSGQYSALLPCHWGREIICDSTDNDGCQDYICYLKRVWNDLVSLLEKGIT